MLLQIGLFTACTTFLVEQQGELAVGKSYDWHQGQGLVLTNQRGVKKHALAFDPRQRTAVWTSKHASLTFNQYGREMPNGGINDAGLVVEIMWLDATEYPPPDERPTVNELQWIQYQLDNFATVAQMVDAKDRIRVAPANGRVHYLACDVSGECAAFEHVGGRLVVSQGAVVLTNDTYAKSDRYRKKKAKKKKRSVPKSTSSLDRFARASHLAGLAEDGPIVDRAFAILDSVRIRGYSKWNIVYEPAARRVHFRTARSPNVKTVTFDTTRADCGTPTMMLDMDTAQAQLIPYAASANAALVTTSLRSLVKDLPPNAEQIVATYPETTRCAE